MSCGSKIDTAALERQRHEKNLRDRDALRRSRNGPGKTRGLSARQSCESERRSEKEAAEEGHHQRRRQEIERQPRRPSAKTGRNGDGDRAGTTKDFTSEAG